MSRGEKDAYGGKLVELDRMTVKAADPWPRAMVLYDAPELYEPRIFVRGNPAQPGDHVPRQFLRVLAGAGRKPFAHGSGRVDLARAITDPDNPLTSRVIVNRVWMHHFGEPLVSTPSDFGTRSTPPSHPGTARLPRQPARGRRLVAQGAAPADRALERVPAVELRPARIAARLTRRTG